MDFGADRLIEMFEERFGKRAGTILLAIVGLALIAASVHIIMSYLVLPVYRIAIGFIDSWHGSLPTVPWATIFTIGIGVVLSVVLAFVQYSYFRFMACRLGRLRATYYMELKEMLDEVRATNAASKNEIRRISQEYLNNAYAITEQIKTAVERERSTTPSPQQSQDTAQRTQP